MEVDANPEGFRCKELTADEAAAAVEEQRKARIWKRHSDDEEGYSLARQVITN